MTEMSEESRAVANVLLAHHREVCRTVRIAAEEISDDLALYDAAGKTRAGLFVLPEGSPCLILRDAAGKVIWEAPK